MNFKKTTIQISGIVLLLLVMLSCVKDVDFDQAFSFFFDYPADTQLASIKSEAHEIIFERLTQDIFNASLADW